MSDPEKPNPFQAPVNASQSPQASDKPPATSESVVRLFVLPFVLAHVVYWPIFLIGLNAFGGYGITGLFMGTGAAAIAGAVYGALLGSKVRDESPLTPSLHPALYALGQALWFLFSLIAPCSVLAIGAGA